MTLERLRYWQGQLLKSRDFRDQLRYQGQLRAWHNAALHGAFGIVAGLEVKNGEVSCGFGYDCLGREVLLPSNRALPPRTSANPQMLVLIPGAPAAAATLAWIDELDWKVSRGLPLGRASGADSTLDSDYGPAPYVRPISRPRLASGETVRGNTPWEIWKEAGVDVGVQTRVDTGASGFTEKPQYFAALKSTKPWQLSSKPGNPAAEFAPAYFAHVTEGTNDGFTFRLLLQDVALQQLKGQTDVARIQRLRRDTGTITASLSSASDFRRGDAVVQVRPRAEAGTLIKNVEGTTITVESTLDMKEDDTLVLGNLPRTAVVKEVTAETDTLVVLNVQAGVIAGSILASIDADPATSRAARIARIEDGKLLLRDPWPELVEGQKVFAFHRKDAVKVSAVKTEGDSTVITVPGNTALIAGDAVLHLTNKRPQPPTRVVSVEAAGSNTKVTLKPPLADLKTNGSIVAARSPVSVSTVETRVGSVEITLTADSPFSERDIIKPAGRSSPPAVVEFSDGAVVRIQAAATWTSDGDTLVAGNLTGALTLEGVRIDAAGRQVVAVARPHVLRTGNAVARVENDGTLSPPSAVTSLGGSELRTDPAIPGLARLQTVVAIQFPALVGITGAGSAPNEVRIDPPGTLAAGDWLAPIESAGRFSIRQVTAILDGGTVVRLSGPLEVAADTMLGQVHFRDTALVSSADSASGEIETDAPLDIDPSFDFVGPLSYYHDNSATAIVDQVRTNDVVLRPLVLNAIPGEGLLQEGDLDPGLLAHASVTPQQRRLALARSSDLHVGDVVTLSGTGDLGTAVSLPVEITAIEDTRVDLAPKLGGVLYSLRPERSLVVSKFNENFPASFAVFAQRQGLYVAWLACQQEPRTYPECGKSDKENPCL